MNKLNATEEKYEKILKSKDKEIILIKDSFQYFIIKNNTKYAFCKNDIESLKICVKYY